MSRHCGLNPFSWTRCALAPLCVVLLLALGSVSSAQEHIDWGQKLKWDDFKGGKPGDDLEAESQVDLIVVSPSCDPKTGKYSFTVKAQFDPKQSTVDPDKKTDALLAHEQLHFDIGEKHANALRKTLIGIMSKKCKCGMSPDDLKALYAEIDAAAKTETDAMNAEQKKYDDETNHGDSAKEKEQKGWSDKIGKELSEAAPAASNAGGGKGTDKATDKPADKPKDDKSNKTPQGDNKKPEPKKDPGDSSSTPTPADGFGGKTITGVGVPCPPKKNNTGYIPFPGTPGQQYATMIPGGYKPGETVSYSTPPFATDSEIYCSFGEGTAVPGYVTASNDDGDFIPPSVIDGQTPGTSPGSGPATTPKPSDTPTPQMTEPKTASTPTPSPSETPTASKPTPTETPVASKPDTPTPTPSETPQQPTDTPTPVVPPDTPPVQITIFIKASEEVLTGGGDNGPPIQGQVIKLVVRDKPNLPTNTGERTLADKGYDKPAPQCTSGADGACKIDVPAEDRPLYALDKTPRRDGKPVNNFRMDVNVMKHTGGVAETTGKQVPDLKDALTASNATAEIIQFGGRTFLRFGFNTPFDSTEELAKKFSELLGVPVEIDICLVKEPGPPLGSEPVSYAAINQELPNATIVLGPVKHRAR